MHYHYTRNEVTAGNVRLHYIPSIANPTDILMKALLPCKHIHILNSLRICRAWGGMLWTLQTNWLTPPRLSGPHRQQLRLTPIISQSIFFLATPQLQPFHLSLHNDEQQQQWLPFHHITLWQQAQWWLPFHHITLRQQAWWRLPFHHIATYEESFLITNPLSSLPHDSWWPLSQSPLTTCFHISMTKDKFRQGTHSCNGHIMTCLT